MKESMTVSQFTSRCIDLLYCACTFKIYPQASWNMITESITTSAISSMIGDETHHQRLILFGHIILLTRSEAPYVKTGKYDSVLSFLVELSQAKFNLFKTTGFSQEVLALLKKYFYDYLEPQGLAELFKVSYL